MSLEAIKQVTQAEQANQARKTEAQAQAKRLVAEAERAGRARLEQARAQAEEQDLAVAAHAEAQRIHFFLILADQLFEGGFIPLLKARNEFPFVHSFLLILSADPA